MSSHPLVDALISQKENELNQEYESILESIENHYNDKSIQLNILPQVIIRKLEDKGFMVSLMLVENVGAKTLVSW